MRVLLLVTLDMPESIPHPRHLTIITVMMLLLTIFGTVDRHQMMTDTLLTHLHMSTLVTRAGPPSTQPARSAARASKIPRTTPAGQTLAYPPWILTGPRSRVCLGPPAWALSVRSAWRLQCRNMASIWLRLSAAPQHMLVGLPLVSLTTTMPTVILAGRRLSRVNSQSLSYGCW